MTRFLSILLLAIAGIPVFGSGLVLGGGQDHACGHVGCNEVVVEATCCSEPTEPAFCPASGGACQCGVAPLPDPQPRPDAPLPGSQRDQIVTAAQAAVRPVPILSAPATHPRVIAARLSLLAGMTHNDIQAFLGTWRT
jgi:hypothetical protein